MISKSVSYIHDNKYWERWYLLININLSLGEIIYKGQGQGRDDGRGREEKSVRELKANIEAEAVEGMRVWAEAEARAKVEIYRIAAEASDSVGKVKTADIIDVIRSHKRLWPLLLTLVQNIDVNIILNLSEHRSLNINKKVILED